MLVWLSNALGVSINALWWIVLLAVMMIATIALQFWMSYTRRMEYLADEYALRVTGNVQGFKNTMMHLATINATPPNAATTHPSLIQRLHHADRYMTKDVQKHGYSI